MTTHELVQRVKTLPTDKSIAQVEKYVTELLNAELRYDPIGRFRMKRIIRRMLANRE